MVLPRWELQESMEGSAALKSSGERNPRVSNGSGQHQGEACGCGASTPSLQSCSVRNTRGDKTSSANGDLGVTSGSTRRMVGNRGAGRERHTAWVFEQLELIPLGRSGHECTACPRGWGAAGMLIPRLSPPWMEGCSEGC